MSNAGYRKWLAFGTGVGIEIDGGHLRLAVARVRPSGVTLLGAADVPDFAERPAAEWGEECAGFLRKTNAAHFAATVLLPRQDVIVRQINLPGVADRDLASAIGYQIDGLHPYAEDEAVYAYARLGKSSSVLVGITRREVVDRLSALFAGAGIKIRSFTFSAAAIYSALRLYAKPPEGFLALEEYATHREAYGESAARPVFSAVFDRLSQRELLQGIAELRLPADVVPVPLHELLPAPKAMPEGCTLEGEALPYATAIAGACPWLSLDANLLPAAQRQSGSRLIYAPTAVLGGLAALMLIMLALQKTYEDHRYLALLEQQIKRYEPQATKVARIEKTIETDKARVQAIDNFRRRSKADMDLLAELTKLIPPPSWVSQLEMTRTTVYIQGEAEQANELLKTLDASPLLQNSELASGVTRVGNLEIFRIRTMREGAPQ